MRFKEFKLQLTESSDPQVLAMQKELKAAGADLGDFGPKHDGLDGMLGPYTRRAAEKFPEIATTLLCSSMAQCRCVLKQIMNGSLK